MNRDLLCWVQVIPFGQQRGVHDFACVGANNHSHPLPLGIKLHGLDAYRAEVGAADIDTTMAVDAAADGGLGTGLVLR